MALPPLLDPELLRAFTLIAEGHSFTQAAAHVGRTQSAVSMQVKRLEELLGQKVLSRGKGGTIELTPHGRYLLGRARQILALNEEVLATFRTPQITGTVRLGTPDDYALSHLPGILRRFAESHPAVQVDVLCASSDHLVHKLKAHELDLTLVSEGNEPRNWPSMPLWRGPLTWVTSTRYAPHRQDPLPLALAHDECSWRAAAVGALEKAGRRYRVAYVSGTQAGTHAAVLAGLAVTVCAITVLPDGLRQMRPDEGLPRLPPFGI
ncbi:MAG TPA: LysR substrate-binding domain-containing protein, partial [Acetobacteraceae bacterium]